MKRSAFIGMLIWVAGFSLIVALIALLWSVSWAILILCVRHILLGIPDVYELWRKIVVGRDEYSRFPKLSKNWPTRSWYIESAVLIILSIGSFFWLNVPLKSFFGFE